MENDPFNQLDECLKQMQKSNSSIPTGWESYIKKSDTLAKAISNSKIDHSCLSNKCQEKGNIIKVDKDTYKCMNSGEIHVCYSDESSCKYITKTETRQTHCYISKSLIGFAHSCIENGCKSKRLIVHISENSFKCLLSGMIHTCSPQNGCKYRLPPNSEGVSVCYLSGFVIPIMTYEKELSKMNADSDDMQEDDSTKMSIEEENENNASAETGTWLGSTSEENGYGNGLRNGKKKKKGLKKKGLKTADKDKDMKKKKKNVFGDVNTMKYAFESIISDILYNTKERSLIDALNIKQAEEVASRLVFQYRRKCIKTRERPNFWIDFDIIQTCDEKRQRLLVVNCNEEKLMYYSDLCLELWNIMTECCYRTELKMSTLTPVSYVLGVLYMLIIPIYSQEAGRQLIPDQYLKTLLPGESDLSKWTHGKYHMSLITEGQKYIRNTMAIIPFDIKLHQYGKINSLFYKYHNVKEMRYYSDQIPLKFLFI